LPLIIILVVSYTVLLSRDQSGNDGGKANLPDDSLRALVIERAILLENAGSKPIHMKGSRHQF